MLHEDLRRDVDAERSSDRVFGLAFGAFLFAVAVWPLVHGRSLRFWALGASVGFVLTALVAPAVLRLPNQWWAKFGILLGNIVSPVALGVLFFGGITPLAALLRLAGKDSLRLRRDAAADSYWIKRDPPGPRPKSMVNQF
jgi:hypothetical protein